MDLLIKLVKTYRLMQSLADRLVLGDELFRIIEPKLRLFVFSSLPRPAAEDGLQEVLKGIVLGLPTFAGNSTSEFWGWCYRIARNKIADHIRKQSAERLQPMSPEEMRRLVDSSTRDSSFSPAERLDLKQAMTLLVEAKPECYEYLWNHFVLGFDYGEIAESKNLAYDNVRMKIGRCLGEVQSLVTNF
jgi:RNA polymerase sigma factor (sigma-70 family)